MKKKVLVFAVMAVMALSLTACGGKKEESSSSVEVTEEATPTPTKEATPKPTKEPTPEVTEEPTEEPTPEVTEEPTEEPTPEPTEEPTPEVTEEPEAEASVIRDDVKAAIDSYEAFVDEYCEFMKSYDATDLTLLPKYTELLAKDVEAEKKFEAIADKDLNDAESAYYTEVSLRCAQKMAEAAAAIG